MKARPELEFCKENIIHLIKDFNRAVRMEHIVLNSKLKPEQAIYDIELFPEYKLIKSNKSTISKVRKNPHELWSKISEPVFEVLVDVLYNHKDEKDCRCLTLWDNHLIYENRPDAHFHINNLIFATGKDYDLESLAGIYRTFKNATSHNDTVMCGLLEIKYQTKGNYLTTLERCQNDHDSEDSQWEYRGTINFHELGFLIWEDAMKTSLRRSYIFKPPHKPNGKVTMIANMSQNMGQTLFNRLVLIDNEPTDNYYASMDYRSEDIPEKFREYLIPENVRKYDFPRFF